MTKQECGELWDHIFKEPRKTTGAMISAISSSVPNQYCGLIEEGFQRKASLLLVDVLK